MPDQPRILTQATDAFVDRAPIDWSALQSSVRTPEERTIVGNLRLLAILRDSSCSGRAAIVPRRWPLWAARLLIVAASLQAAANLMLIGAALLGGASTKGRLSQMAFAVAFGLASGLLATAASRDPRSLFLAAAFASSAAAFARGASLAIVPHWPLPMPVILPEAFTPACFWEFALDFPRVDRFTRFDRLATGAATGAWMLGALLFSVNLLLSNHFHPGTLPTRLLRYDSSQLFWKLLLCTAGPAIATILFRSKGAPSRERRRLARFASALAIGTAPLLLLGITRLVVPSLDRWFVTATSLTRYWLYQFVTTALMATPIASATALLTDHPFDDQAPVWHALGSMRKRFGRWSRRLRNSGVAEDQGHLTRALARIRNARGQREIFAVLARELSRASGAGGALVVAAKDLSGDLPPFSREAALGAVVLKESDPLDLSPEGGLLALLPEEDRDWLLSEDVTLACGIRYRNGTLAGIAVLRRKRNGLSFGPLDLWLVTSLTSAAGAACDALRSPGQSARLATDLSATDDVAFECPRCGTVSASKIVGCGCPTDAILAGLPLHLAGKFIVSRRLGAGGMGVVYLARDTTLGREVALKTLPALEPAAVRRLQAEARTMAGLGHESLATIYGLETWRGTPVLVVEYFPLGTLADAIRKGPLPTMDVVRLGVTLARALDHMHKHGMLHRDIKPSNIGFTSTGAAKLLDFGLASLASPAVGVTDAKVVDGTWRMALDRDSDGREYRRVAASGTRGYLPPEAPGGQPASPAFDLWALSVTLLEAAIGSSPLQDSRRRSLSSRADVGEAQVRRICSQRFAHQPALARFFRRALTHDPAQRDKTAAEMQETLEDVLRKL